MSIISPDQTAESIRIAVKYINDRRTPDGGYFFARVPPGSLLDTCFAVKSLHMLGLKPRRVASLKQFIRSFQADYIGGNIHALYLAAGILRALDGTLESLQIYRESALRRFKLDELRKFEMLDVEVVSELKAVFESVSLFRALGVRLDKKPVIEFVLSLFNSDGGFGRNATSTLPTTYYAVNTLRAIDSPLPAPANILKYLAGRQEDIYYLEDLFYLMMTRSTLGKISFHKEDNQTISLILGYQRANGGFARARPIGIPTLEYTYYALSLLKMLKMV